MCRKAASTCMTEPIEPDLDGDARKLEVSRLTGAWQRQPRPACTGCSSSSTTSSAPAVFCPSDCLFHSLSGASDPPAVSKILLEPWLSLDDRIQLIESVKQVKAVRSVVRLWLMDWAWFTIIICVTFIISLFPFVLWPCLLIYLTISVRVGLSIPHVVRGIDLQND